MSTQPKDFILRKISPDGTAVHKLGHYFKFRTHDSVWQTVPPPILHVLLAVTELYRDVRYLVTLLCSQYYIHFSYNHSNLDDEL